MKIDQDTRQRMTTQASDFGGALTGLLPSAAPPGSCTLFEIRKGLLGSEGELLCPDRYIRFRSDRGLSRLKQSSEQPYGELTGLSMDGGSCWTRWRFEGPVSGFEIELEHYRGRNGLGPGQIIWYDIDEFPVRAGIFFDAASAVLSRSPQCTLYDNPAAASRTLDEALRAFEDGPLHTDSLSQPDPYHVWTGMRQAFSAVLAGTMLSGDRDEAGWKEVFDRLDDCYAGVLSRFLPEMDAGSRAIPGESAIHRLSDQFERLSSLWYTRQIARICFAGRRGLEAREWSLSILTPRALQAGGRISIRLRERSMYEEEIARLRN